MRHLNVTDNPHTWLVYHTTGFMEQGMEDFQYRELVFSVDNYDEALVEARKRYPSDPSGWTYDGFSIDLNIATEEGQRIAEEQRVEFERKWAEIEARGDYTTHVINGITVKMQYNAAFDHPNLPTPVLESYRFVFLDGETPK